jgi:hypothetical protein
MNWENSDPTLFQMMTQLLYLKQQFTEKPISGTNPDNLILALGDFINQIGAEIQSQAT